MVHLTARRVVETLDPESRNSVVIEVVRESNELLASGQPTLLEQLFALSSCSMAGDLLSSADAHLHRALDDVEWRLGLNWEPDVPSLCLLAGYVAALDAARAVLPESAGPRLEEALGRVAARKSALGLASDPHLLASAVRAAAILGIELPSEIRSAVETTANAALDPVALADLIEAASRTASLRGHLLGSAGRRLAQLEDHPLHAVAHWWLADRLRPDPREAGGHEFGEGILQLRALVCDVRGDYFATAMRAEVTARYARQLRVINLDGALRIRAYVKRRHILIDRTVWTAIACVALAVAIGHSRTVATAVASWASKPGQGHPLGVALEALLCGALGEVLALYGIGSVGLMRSRAVSSTVTTAVLALALVAGTVLGLALQLL